jgi:hypothetical protein
MRVVTSQYRVNASRNGTRRLVQSKDSTDLRVGSLLFAFDYQHMVDTAFEIFERLTLAIHGIGGDGGILSSTIVQLHAGAEIK